MTEKGGFALVARLFLHIMKKVLYIYLVHFYKRALAKQRKGNFAHPKGGRYVFFFSFTGF